MSMGADEMGETIPREPDAGPASTVWAVCPACEGRGRTAGRTCALCAGSGKLSADVAEDSGDTAEMDFKPTDEV